LLDLLVLLDQAKSTRKNLREEKFPDRFFGKIPTFSSGISCKKIFTTFCHQKVVPKVSAGRKSWGTADGLRLKRYADELAPAFSTAQPPPVLLPDFSQCGDSCALRATKIIHSIDRRAAVRSRPVRRAAPRLGSSESIFRRPRADR
jgi:hypothetical protein